MTLLARKFLMFSGLLSVALAVFGQTQQPSVRARTAEVPPRKASPVAVVACKHLEALGTVMDDAENKGKLDHILAAIAGVDKYFGDLSPGDPDSTWNELVECANQTRDDSERAEALRVAAMWEHWRAESLAKQYRAAQPVKSPQCRDLDMLVGRVDAAVKSREDIPNDEVRSVAQSLQVCAEDSEKLNGDREASEALIARGRMFQWVGLAYNNLLAKAQRETDKAQREAAEQTHRDAEDKAWQTALANPSSLVSIRAGSKVTGAQLGLVAEHNRALCDQIITVAKLTPNGLRLEYGSPDGRKWMAKKYPRACLLEDGTHLAPGVPRYLLVYADFQNALAGFQPVQRTTSSPVTGSGTVTNAYGNTWNFTYTGTVEATETVETPYVISSQSLYLTAYDENGHVVSQHSITRSSQTGGDAGYAAGYNTGSLISGLWNNPQRLAASVLKDVQKDSMKYSKN